MQKNSVSGRQKLHIFPTRHSLGTPTFYICIKKQFHRTWTQNKPYQTERFQQFEAMISLEQKKAKTRHDTNLLRGIHCKKITNCLYKTSFEKLSSVALGCRTGLSLSSFCERLLTSLFTFLLIRSRGQV